MDKNQSKKKRNLIQPTIFGVEKFPLTQKKTKKIGQNEFQVVGEFVRKETGKEADKKGVFKAKCSYCSKDFLTTNALGSHVKFCDSAIAEKSKEASTGQNPDEMSCVLFLKGKSIARDGKKNQLEKDRRETRAALNHNEESTNDPKIDKRQGNRGAATRHSYSARKKIELVESVNEYLNEYAIENERTVTKYFSDVMKCRPNELQQMCNRFYKWRKHDAYERCLREVLNLKKNQDGSKRKGTNRASPFQEIETELYAKIVEFRRNGRKISANWIRINARKIFIEKQNNNPGRWGNIEFQASYGWMRRFMARRNMKYKKRKNGKEKTAEECVAEFEIFLEKLRFDFLAPRDDSPSVDHETIWGRFPPELRYNMDQVPLPFVNGQDTTFTTDDDVDVNLKCPKESLRYRI